MSNLTSRREPYVGPRPFKREDQNFFFGRDDESNDLVSLITAHPVVLLYAQSGAGKTSLLNARVIPLLEQEEFDVLGPLRVTRELPPGLDVEQVNLYMFNALGDKLTQEGEHSRPAPLTLDEYLKKTYPTDEGRLLNPCVVIFDQFEELFTFYPERWKDRGGFFEQLNKALEDPLLRVVLAMREDYIAELEPYEELLPERLRTRFRLERLRQDAALLAVKEPLKQSEFGFAPGVAEQLVDDLLTIPSKKTGGANAKGEYVETVQLQVVCQRLWKKLQPHERTITHEHLKDHGDVNAALSAFYEECVQGAAAESEEKEGTIRNWFEKKLITENGKRGKVFRGPLRTGGLSNVAVDKLEEFHIIRAEVSGGERWYELSHERFIQPVQESNKNWLEARSSAVSTQKYLEEKAAKSELLDEGELLVAQHWLDSPVAAEMDIADNLKGLIVASEAAIAEKKAAQQREIAMAQTIAEEQRQRAEAERLKARADRKRVRQLRWGLALLSVLLVFAITKTIAAGKAQEVAEQAQRSEAEQKLIAQQSAQVAQQNAKEAEEARARAAEQREIAQRNAQIAQQRASDAEAARASEAEQRLLAQQRAIDAEAARSLADQAALNAKAAEAREAEQKVFAQQQAKEAVEARAREAEQKVFAQQRASDAEEARNDAEAAKERAYQNAKEALIARSEAIGLLRTIQQIDKTNFHNELTLRGHKDEVTNAMIGPHGESILTSSKDGTARLWNVNAGVDQKPISLDSDGDEEDPDADHPQINNATLSADGKLAATARNDGTARISEAATGKLVTQLSGHSGPVMTATFSSDGKSLVTASKDGAARVWNTATGLMVQVLRADQGPLASAQFSPDKQSVLTISEGHKATLWNIADGKLKAVLGATVAKADFSPDSKFVVTVSGDQNDKTAQVWDAETGTPRTQLSGHRDRVTSAAFSKDPTGHYIVTTSEDGAARVWDAGKHVPFGSKRGVTRKELREHRGLLVSYEKNQILNFLPAISFTMIRPQFEGMKVAAFSPYGQDKNGKPRYVVTGDETGTVKLWDIQIGWKVTEFHGHIGPITSVGFGPGGKLIMTTGEDGTVRLWNPCAHISPVDRLNRLLKYC